MDVLIIEDEDAAVRRLAKLIQEIDPDMQVIATLDSIESALIWFEENPMPELLFLDIHLADGSSFELFQHLSITKPIIFTTAYDQYAIQAFKVNAIDYLLKPIKKNELQEALSKYKNLEKKQIIDYQALAKAVNREEYSKRFLIRFGQQIKVIEMQDAAYFYTLEKITFLVSKEGKRYPMDHSLDRLEEMADPKQFFRINRQFIINIHAIKEMYAYSKSRIKIELEPACDLETIVSTERSPLFKKWLTGE
ncbi:MAG TPA: LytTR family DNA-binding domain-containing protein [Saprospiraceae bacterium]|nr:LytTR family DNA-binding domain-containing protein [Saprospiraceae bacterium]HMQ81268.1 LytTR family DNA-binding domain-containing protein [Saprospiraceae bacterium]